MTGDPLECVTRLLPRGRGVSRAEAGSLGASIRAEAAAAGVRDVPGFVAWLVVRGGLDRAAAEAEVSELLALYRREEEPR